MTTRRKLMISFGLKGVLAVMIGCMIIIIQNDKASAANSASCMDKSGRMKPVATPLVMWATPDAHNAPGKRGITLSVVNCTDMGGENAQVTITTCREGQSTPFHVDRTRHLSGPAGFGESLTAINGGKIVVWNTGLVPSFIDGPRTLHLVFNLDKNKGGPTFCATAAGLSESSATSTPVISTVWSTK